MRYIKFYGTNGYCGCDYENWMIFDDNTPDHVIDGVSIDLAIDNADMYEDNILNYNNPFADKEYKEYIDNAIEYADWKEISKNEYDLKI